MKMFATISARYAPTDRFVTCSDNYGLAISWAEIKSKRKLLKHKTSQTFVEALKQVKIIDKEYLELYRGRPKKDIPNPDSLMMGPPPECSRISEGRYNQKGESVLYLSNSPTGVIKELQKRDNEIWIQQFTLPTKDLRLADLTIYEPESLINAVMWHCELAGNEGYPSLIFSQTIAEILKRQKFDGAFVLGVRGDEIEKYNNVFILNPLDRWKNWINIEKPPYIFNT